MISIRSRGHGTAGAIGLALTLTLAGCAGTSGSADFAAPSGAAATPTQPTAATTPAIDLADPSSWVVDFESVGPVTLGASLDSLPTLMPTFELTHQEQCPPVSYFTSAGLPTVITPDRSGAGSVDQIVLAGWSVDNPVISTPHTATGIGIGSTIADVEAAYPGVAVTTSKFGNPTASVPGPDGTYINFAAKADGTIDTVVIGPQSVIPDEFCG